MRIYLPRTMTGLVTAGGLLATAPLLLAVLLVNIALEHISQHSEALVEEGLTVTRLGTELRDNLNNLERNARQYVALGDPDLLEVFNQRWRDTEMTLQELEQRGLQDGYGDHLRRIHEGLTDASNEWSNGLQDEPSKAAALDRIHALGPEPEAIIALGRAAVDAQVTQLRKATAIARKVMLLSILALVPLAAVLIFSFSVAVMRPLKKMSWSIAALGHRRYDKPISIRFPSEMRRLGEHLDWLRRRLAQLEQDKDQFLRHVSHELKTPLASLHEGVGLLRDRALGPLTSRQLEVTQILVESTKELETLIDNLLAYAEWRQERRQTEMSWFDARPMVNEVLTAHKLSLIKRRLSVELKIGSPRLFGQRARLSEALGNLLSNAVKHTPEGSTISLYAGMSMGVCSLSIADRGRGVPADERNKIFEPFVRGSEAEESGIRGTGVGLSIVKETILAHKGTVEVNDEQPGARFTLVWPCPSDYPA